MIWGKLKLYLLGSIALLVLATGLYLVAYERGKQSVLNRALKETVAKIEVQRDVEYVIMTKPKVEVQNELEQKWCRDCR
jgi:glucose uptake protein GlcU